MAVSGPGRAVSSRAAPQSRAETTGRRSPRRLDQISPGKKGVQRLPLLSATCLELGLELGIFSQGTRGPHLGCSLMVGSDERHTWWPEISCNLLSSTWDRVVIYLAPPATPSHEFPVSFLSISV